MITINQVNTHPSQEVLKHEGLSVYHRIKKIRKHSFPSIHSSAFVHFCSSVRPLLLMLISTPFPPPASPPSKCLIFGWVLFILRHIMTIKSLTFTLSNHLMTSGFFLPSCLSFFSRRCDENIPTKATPGERVYLAQSSRSSTTGEVRAAGAWEVVGHIASTVKEQADKCQLVLSSFSHFI